MASQTTQDDQTKSFNFQSPRRTGVQNHTGGFGHIQVRYMYIYSQTPIGQLRMHPLSGLHLALSYNVHLHTNGDVVALLLLHCLCLASTCFCLARYANVHRRCIYHIYNFTQPPHGSHLASTLEPVALALMFLLFVSNPVTVYASKVWCVLGTLRPQVPRNIQLHSTTSWISRNTNTHALQQT